MCMCAADIAAERPSFWGQIVLTGCALAGIAENVKEKPVGVEILGEKVVLFRDSTGTVRCINDVCPHRGAPLHQGWVAEVAGHDCVVCPYHGWAFDAEGILRDVPAAETSEAWPHKPLVDSYPVEEKVSQLCRSH